MNKKYQPSKKIEQAIESRRKDAALIHDLLSKELNRMIKNQEPISVSGLAKRCYVTRSTVYHHRDIYELLVYHRDKQFIEQHTPNKEEN